MEFDIHYTTPNTKRANLQIRPIYKHWLDDYRKKQKKQSGALPNQNLIKHVIPIHLVQYENFVVKLQYYFEQLFDSKRPRVQPTLFQGCLDTIAKHLCSYRPEDIGQLGSYLSEDDLDYLHFRSCMSNTLTADHLQAFVRPNMQNTYFSGVITPEAIHSFADKLSRVYATTVETVCDSWEELDEVAIYDGRNNIHTIIYLQDEFSIPSFHCIAENFHHLQHLQLIQTNLTVNDIKREEAEAQHLTTEFFRMILTHNQSLQTITLMFCQWLRWPSIRSFIPEIQALRSQQVLQWRRIEVHGVLCYLQQDNHPQYQTMESEWLLFAEMFRQLAQIEVVIS